jgi:putative mRNA 3-end processing factor
MLDDSIGPIYTHGAVEKLTRAYREAGIALPPTQYAGVFEDAGKKQKRKWAGSLVIAPPSAVGSPWVRKFAPASLAAASGWMRIRGTRRRKALDRGFVVSDHADWPGLLGAIKDTGAEDVWVTHGYTAVLARYLREQGLNASVVKTSFEGEGRVEDADEESVGITLPKGDQQPERPANADAAGE